MAASLSIIGSGNQKQDGIRISHLSELLAVDNN